MKGSIDAPVVIFAFLIIVGIGMVGVGLYLIPSQVPTISPPVYPSPKKTVCIDSDNGLSGYYYGYASNSTMYSADVCADNMVLKEAYCVGANVFYQTQHCSGLYGKNYVCKSGRCVYASPSVSIQPPLPNHANAPIEYPQNNPSSIGQRKTRYFNITQPEMETKLNQIFNQRKSDAALIRNFARGQDYFAKYKCTSYIVNSAQLIENETAKEWFSIMIYSCQDGSFYDLGIDSIRQMDIYGFRSGTVSFDYILGRKYMWYKHNVDQFEQFFMACADFGVRLDWGQWTPSEKIKPGVIAALNDIAQLCSKLEKERAIEPNVSTPGNSSTKPDIQKLKSIMIANSPNYREIIGGAYENTTTCQRTIIYNGATSDFQNYRILESVDCPTSIPDSDYLKVLRYWEKDLLWTDYPLTSNNQLVHIYTSATDPTYYSFALICNGDLLYFSGKPGLGDKNTGERISILNQITSYCNELETV